MDVDKANSHSPMVTNKWSCRQLAAALVAYGVKHVITSPGSRNAPLIMAVERNPALTVWSVIDERSAGFVALGMAVQTGLPVALVCTSGTAMLNYAPALAEAFYRNVPLIAITADRPMEWIDQDDSQTIRQVGALANIVKGSWAIKGEADTDEERWFANRQINDSLLSATGVRPGPVHVNVALSAPLTEQVPAVQADDAFRKIDVFRVPDVLPNDDARRFAAELHAKKILIVAGFAAPDARINKAIGILARLPNVVVIAEPLANIKCPGAHLPDYHVLDKAASAQSPDIYAPDVLITFGGALVSGKLKNYLRGMRVHEHWHIGHTDQSIDCFKHLTRRIEISPAGFLPKFSTSMRFLSRNGRGIMPGYADEWEKLFALHSARPYPQAWCALSSVKTLLDKVPATWNLQLSNGMTVRYALTLGTSRLHRADCNRGVSGIDGSVSTALGASVNYPHPTLLITGDMSMQYDLAALSSTLLSPKLKIAVINNGGGGIFKFISPTANLPEMPKLLNGTLNLPLEQLANAYSLRYLRASNHEELSSAVKMMIAESELPVILEIITDGATDADEMKTFLGII